MTQNLNDFVRNNSKFLRLSNGESFEGTYVAFKVTQSPFDPEKETVVYKLRYDDGKDTYFQTSSVAVAKTFGKMNGGEKIRIKREGEGQKTKYIITSPDVQVSEDELEPDSEIQF